MIPFVTSEVMLAGNPYYAMQITFTWSWSTSDKRTHAAHMMVVLNANGMSKLMGNHYGRMPKHCNLEVLRMRSDVFLDPPICVLFDFRPPCIPSRFSFRSDSITRFVI